MKWIAENDQYRLTVEPDPVPMDPREWDNLGTMLCWSVLYQLGDEPNANSLEILDELYEDPDMIVLPLFLLDHTVLKISTTPFHLGGGPGPLGCIYAPRGAEGLCDDRIKELFKGEVETYDLYLRGEVYYFCLEEKDTCAECGHTEYEVVDSCGSFFGDAEEEMFEQIREHLESDARGLVDELQAAEELC